MRALQKGMGAVEQEIGIGRGGNVGIVGQYYTMKHMKMGYV